MTSTSFEHKVLSFSGGTSGSTIKIETTAKRAYIDNINVYYNVTSATANPTFSPVAGTYTSAQNVTLSSTTSGAKIYYTTDGMTTPSSASTPYTGAIALNSTATTTIQAIAYDASNANPSDVTSATYTINLNPTINSTPATLSAFSAVVGTPYSRTLTVSGTNLTADITAALDDATQFQVSPATVTQSSGTAAATTVTVTYNPTAAGTHTATLTLSSGSATPVTYSLSGTATWPPLATPVATAATSITNAGFTANWNAVSGATTYDLNLYTKSGTKIAEGFDAVGTSGTPVPTDWIFTNITTTYTSTGYFNNAAPSLKFDASGDIVVTPTYSAPATTISFWIRGASTDATSALLVEGSTDGLTWNTIENINPLPTSGTLKTYNSGSTPALTANFIKFRFTYTKSAGNVAFDDFTYLNNYSENAITGSPFTGISGTSNALTGLQRGTAYYYTVIAKNTNVTSSTSNEITANTTNNSSTVADGLWSTASTWADATVPPSGADVIVNNTIAIDQNLTVSSIAINAGNSLSINAGKQFTVGNTLTNNGALNLLSSAVDGTATILTPATITTGTGATYSVQQYLTGSLNSGTGFPNGRMWYVATPVTGTGVNSGVFDAAANANKLWYYTESAHGYTEITDNTTDLTVGTGYVARMGANTTVNFSGTGLYTGDKLISLTYNTGDVKSGFNLIGNPYPSFLDWKAVTLPASVMPTIWVRSFSGSAMGFDTYNASTGAGVSSNGNTVTQYIAPMQAFWVEVNAPSTITVTNAMRYAQDQTTNGNKLKAPAVNATAQQLLRLQVTNGTNSDESIIAFNANASDAYDRYDSHKMANNEATLPEIYTLAGSDQLAINCLKSLTSNEVIPLGFTTGEANTFTLKVTQADNFDADTKIILKDNVQNTERDLTDGTPYSFTSDITSSADRFSIVFRSASATTGLDSNADNNPLFLVYRGSNNRIKINYNGNLSTDVTVSVYNTVGQKLQSKRITSTNTEMTALCSGVYLVSVTTDGKSITKKVILN